MAKQLFNGSVLQFGCTKVIYSKDKYDAEYIDLIIKNSDNITNLHIDICDNDPREIQKGLNELFDKIIKDHKGKIEEWHD